MSLITFCIINNKGGVGKTTTAVSLSTIASLSDKKILSIDMDPQGNLSQTFHAYNKDNSDISDLIFNKNEECISHSEYNVDIIQNSGEVQDPSIRWTEQKDKDIFILRKFLQKKKDDYDFCFIDTSPSSSIFSDIALIASDYVVIPSDASSYSYSGTGNLISHIYEIHDNYASWLSLLGTIICNEKTNTKAYRRAEKGYSEIFGNILGRIPQDTSIKESPFMPIYYYKKRTRAGEAYLKTAMALGIISINEYKTLVKEYGVKR